MAQQTKLKFRQAGQNALSDVAKRDLRAELLIAEQEARDRKRKADGKPVATLSIENTSTDEETSKRRKLLQEALELDKDDDEEDDKPEATKSEVGENEDEEEEEEEEEDDTAELLRELEKIKRERAEEKARQDAESKAQADSAREADIATSNPLLNLAAALGQNPNGLSTTAPGTFAVKRRWDDDLIFKNQAVGTTDKPGGQFINDLLRTEFHKKFMAKFVK